MSAAVNSRALHQRDAERLRVVRADLVHDERLLVAVEPGTSTAQPPLPNGCADVLTAAAVTPGTRAMLGRSFLEEQHATRRDRDTSARAAAPLSVNTRSGRKPSPTRPTASTVLDHQARADHQHDRQRDRADHEALAKQRLSRATRHAPAAAAKRVDQIAGAGVERRRQTEDHAGRRRDRQREQQHRHIERDLGFVGDRVWRDERQDRRAARHRRAPCQERRPPSPGARSRSATGAPAATGFPRVRLARPFHAAFRRPSTAAGSTRWRRRSTAAIPPRQKAPTSSRGCCSGMSP